jgi:hypothetical protein
VSAEPLPRLGETSEFGGLLLQTLALNGWRPELASQGTSGGVRVRLHHPSLDEPIEMFGPDLATIAPELVKRAVAAVRGR